MSEVLGYPACCVREYFEAGVRMSEAVVRGYQTQYGAKDADDFIRLAKEKAVVTIPPRDLPQIRHVFSYVQFSACRECAESSTSPAAEMNWAMRRLASRLSPGFQRAIEKAVKVEVAVRRRQIRR